MVPLFAPSIHSSAASASVTFDRCPQGARSDTGLSVSPPALRLGQRLERLADLLVVPLRVDPRLIRRRAVAAPTVARAARAGVAGADAGGHQLAFRATCQPYGVRPRGLNIASTVAASKRMRAAPEWSMNVGARRSLRLSPDPAASRAKKPTVGV